MSKQQVPDDDSHETIAIDGVDAEIVSNREEEAAIEMHPLVELLTPRAKVKIIVALHRLRPEKLSPSGICERAHISPNTWYDHHEELLDYGVIEQAGNAGNSPLYRVNTDSEITQVITDLVGVTAQKKHELLFEQRVSE